MALGRRVLLLDPFGAVRGLQEQRPELKGLPVEFVRRNPLDFLRKGSKGVKDFGVLLDALLTPPTSQSDAARPFHDAARAIIGGYVGWVRFGPGMDGDRTLGPFRRLLRSNQDEATKLEELLGKFPDMAFGRVVEAVKRMERVGAQEAGSNLFTIAGQLQASPTETLRSGTGSYSRPCFQSAGEFGDDHKFRAGQLAVLPDIRGAPRSVEPPPQIQYVEGCHNRRLADQLLTESEHRPNEVSQRFRIGVHGHRVFGKVNARGGKPAANP